MASTSAAATNNGAQEVEVSNGPLKGRNIVVCCDGTGIGEDHSAGEIVTPSNIVKIFNCLDTTAISGDQREQLAYYERGVGSVGNLLTKAGQGLTGAGIGAKIRILYHWLGVHWRDYPADTEEEDRLFLFGFSRGAFAVRSLMGMIYRVGLLDLSGLDAKEAYRRAEIAYRQGYERSKPREQWAKGNKTTRDKTELWKFHGDKETGHIPIQCVGVFDTVGQLGLPRETCLLWACGAMCYFAPKKSHFHDVTINSLVKCGLHAVAIDEMRSTFQPVFDRSGKERAKRGVHPDARLKQVWFPGGHANVGGGVLDTGLSDGSLKWMIDEAAKEGLRFSAQMVEQIKPNFQGNIFHKHSTALYKNMTYYPRSTPAIIPENVEGVSTAIETIHASALARSQNPSITQAPYFATRYLAVGEVYITTINANQVYNSTFVYMEPGQSFDITADGMWSGFRHRVCGPEGYTLRDFLTIPKTLIRTGMGRLERGVRRLFQNMEARLPMTRRHDRHAWFKVMGMITCGGTRNVVAEADVHTIFGIGSHVEYTVGERGGYLYCYANDSWNHYVKNRGIMQLTIKRTK